MPGLTQHRNDNFQFSNAAASPYSLSSSVSTSGFWAKHRDDVSYSQLQKFWSELSRQARQELLRIDKQTLFEQARKNMYCSRCNGLLLEGFLQIVMYGKSLPQEGTNGNVHYNRVGASRKENDASLQLTLGCHDDVQDPSVHPWGGLTTARDGTLTLQDCYLYAKSLKGLQNVFDSARARERERELLYPDACGGGGRGWISQGALGYGRGHGTRETCALHTARLSVDTLVDFWSALGEETRQSLLRMKEEDFIERLMYRFDSKRFCRDCRRNVIREFKELKELKRMRREPHCTSWFCAADTSFQYEVSLDTVQADWHQTFVDTIGIYHHFEWAIGTGEGKSDILEFENVGLSARVEVNGLDLTGFNACYINLRAWKIDGRCTELSVKAHALKGQQCVHCRLVVGDGFVTITRGEGIRRFFEHAEEAEEEEDDDSVDKDGNELDGECSRPQKHAKSPELAREFLLDAATVTFKEQVEKAFREGTARQNAHSIFVSLALKLLEERVHVAFKEIITLEKQKKLLEEEETERREEEERKERRRAKEREKKLRRKERLKEKERERDKKCSPPNETSNFNGTNEVELTSSVEEEPNVGDNLDSHFETREEEEESVTSTMLPSSYFQDDHSLISSEENPNVDLGFVEKGYNSCLTGQLKNSHRKMKLWKEYQVDQKWFDRRRFALVSDSGGAVSKSEQRYHSNDSNGLNKQPRSNNSRHNFRISAPKYGERLNCTHNRMNHLFRSCSCHQHSEYREKGGKSESDHDNFKPFYRGKLCNQPDYINENFGRHKGRIIKGNTSAPSKKVWEPMDLQKKYYRSNSDSDFTLRSSLPSVAEPCKSSNKIAKSIETVSVESFHENLGSKDSIKGFNVEATADDEVETYDMTTSSLNGTSDSSTSSNSNSDGSSPFLSEGDGNISSSSSNPQNPESLSTSDSEDAAQNPDVDEPLPLSENNFSLERNPSENSDAGLGSETLGNLLSEATLTFDNGLRNNLTGSQPRESINISPSQTESLPFPIFQPPPLGYYHQSPLSWPSTLANGFPFPHPNHYLFANPYAFNLNANFGFTPYGTGTVQHFAPPVLNPSQVPFYPTVSTANGFTSEEHSKIQNTETGPKIGLSEKLNRGMATKPGLVEVPNGVKGQHGGCNQERGGNTAGFSLFHFGGPFALSNGLKSEPDISWNEDRIEDDKGDCAEEYNLFAAKNGIEFSFL